MINRIKNDTDLEHILRDNVKGIESVQIIDQIFKKVQGTYLRLQMKNNELNKRQTTFA